MAFRLPREARVRKRGAFIEIQRQGHKVAGTYLLLFVRDQRRNDKSPGPARLGVTVSRRVGGAVVRNHVKRLLREVYRLNPAWFPAGRDYVFVAKPEAAKLDLHGAQSEVHRLCERHDRKART
jgi:ribonuclease P protein component